MIMLSFVMLSASLNSVFSPIQQAWYIDVSISEFQKNHWKLSARVMLLHVSSTILWRCELIKTPHNGNLKKPVITIFSSKT